MILAQTDFIGDIELTQSADIKRLLILLLQQTKKSIYV